MKCRFCNSKELIKLLDVGFAPPSNSYINIADRNKPEINYPLKVNLCISCFLAQTEDYTKAEELFTPDYAYFSSNSLTLLKHAKDYVDIVEKKLGFFLVVRISSNKLFAFLQFI